jgi:DNA-binding response OmpR family regulator
MDNQEDRSDIKESKQNLILVIEDNPSYQQMLKHWLESQGYLTCIAKDGMEGLNAARKMKPDLIVLDLLLPSIDGLQVCRMIKFDQKLKNIPIVILTSRDLDDDEESARKFGADAFIVKTTRIEIVMDVIKRLLERVKSKK